MRNLPLQNDLPVRNDVCSLHTSTWMADIYKINTGNGHVCSDDGGTDECLVHIYRDMLSHYKYTRTSALEHAFLLGDEVLALIPSYRTLFFVRKNAYVHEVELNRLAIVGYFDMP